MIEALLALHYLSVNYLAICINSDPLSLCVCYCFSLSIRVLTLDHLYNILGILNQICTLFVFNQCYNFTLADLSFRVTDI